MFKLTDIKEYWCIVSINDSKDDMRILKESQDVRNSTEFEIEDYDLEYSCVYWEGKHQMDAGIYKLMLEPTYNEPDEDDEDAPKEREFDVLTVVSYELLMAI